MFRCEVSKEIAGNTNRPHLTLSAGRFIARKNWIVCGSDDFQLRVGKPPPYIAFFTDRTTGYELQVGQVLSVTSLLY
jgi:hypothetical protein